MTIRHWIWAGWQLLVLALLLAVGAALEVFGSVETVRMRPEVIAPGGGLLIDAAEFLRGVVLAVLSGAAFFGGLACFFWRAAIRREELLTALAADLSGRRVEQRDQVGAGEGAQVVAGVQGDAAVRREVE